MTTIHAQQILLAAINIPWSNIVIKQIHKNESVEGTAANTELGNKTSLERPFETGKTSTIQQQRESPYN